MDSTANYKVFIFLDAFAGYNQIKLVVEDQLHTLFVTYFGTYYYSVMPFGLKNTGATYQGMVTASFTDLIDKSMEVYMENMIMKSKHTYDHIRDLRVDTSRKLSMEVYVNILNNNQIRLNPAKCMFGVTSGKFLGYFISRKGIEITPNKIKVVMEMTKPRKLRDIQRLT